MTITLDFSFSILIMLNLIKQDQSFSHHGKLITTPADKAAITHKKKENRRGEGRIVDHSLRLALLGQFKRSEVGCALHLKST